MNTVSNNVGGLILAAGQSIRMGRPKLTLAWGETTVIGQVVQCLLQGGVSPLIVVTGGARWEVETALHGFPVKMIYNPGYESGEMLSSLHAGLSEVGVGCQAVLIALGDQPQIQVDTVRAIIKTYRETSSPLIVPSYQMRRGHPWLVGQSLWPELLALGPPLTMRDFLIQHQLDIFYLPVTDSGVIQDLDTPDQYDQSHP